MEQYAVSGMTCAACSARVERAVKNVKGVTSCSVSLLTNSMGVEGSASRQAVVQAVEKAGYGARPLSSSADGNEDLLKDKESPLLAKRLVFSAFFLLALMYVSMGHSMFGFSLPSFFSGNYVSVGILELLLSAIVMVINKKFFVNGTKALFNLSPNMDTLVALGSGVSFLYSVYALFMMSDAQLKHGSAAACVWMKDFYFEGAAMIVTLITVGKLLESLSKGKTTVALKELMNLAPKTATLIRQEKEVQVPVEEVLKGDVFIVKPGESIPVDGIIIEGSASINEASLTGESIPADKKEGDNVSAATVNQNGFIKCKAVRVGKDTTLSQIIQMVSDAAATKAPVAKVADTVSGVFVPVVIALAIVTTVVWLLCGKDAGFALSRGIGVLVVSCPCALGLATPVAIMVGNGIAAKNGILFKTSAALEECARIKIVALDKTGTITKGEPVVTDVVPFENTLKDELLQTAFALESKSEHPIAKAVVSYSKEQNVKILGVTDFKEVAGNGLCGAIEEKQAFGGSLEFIQKNTGVPLKSLRRQSLEEDGKTVFGFAKDGKFLGLIAVADAVKDDSVRAIKELKDLGLYTVMLTGDNERTAEAVAKTAGVDKVVSHVLPGGKEKEVRALKTKGKVLMVGDGINDAPALTRADVGIAIGNGTDVAIEAANVVLMKPSLLGAVRAIRLGRAVLKTIHGNLFWAFFYNALLIPVAAGAYYKAFNLVVNPMLCAAAMSLSSFCVVMNALRLNFVNIKKSSLNKKTSLLRHRLLNGSLESHEEDKNINLTEEKSMEEQKTLKIEGMMCTHCEAHVKEALEALDGVKEAAADHEKGEAVLTLTKSVADSALAEAVEKAGYKVLQ